MDVPDKQLLEPDATPTRIHMAHLQGMDSVIRVHM